MRRKLFNLLSAVSLLLFVVVVVVGVRSFFSYDSIAYGSAAAAPGGGGHISHCAAAASRGRILLSAGRDTVVTAQGWQRLCAIYSSSGMLNGFRWLAGRAFDLGVQHSRLGDTARALGFSLEAYRHQRMGIAEETAQLTSYILILPAWFLALLFAILPALWLRRRRIERKRNRIGFCQHCGYDLRATPSRCPECGTAVPAPPRRPPRRVCPPELPAPFRRHTLRGFGYTPRPCGTSSSIFSRRFR